MGEVVKKIAVVVPRYGQEVTGPVPNYAYELVQKLKGFYSIDVLTTTASDYETWSNHFPEGKSEEEGITIWRFRTTQNRDIEEFEKLDAMRERLGVLGASLDQKRIYAQGPLTRGLAAYIKEHKDEYDRFIFITFQYFTTAYAYHNVSDKSILIPLVSPELDVKQIKYKVYKDIFKSVRGIIFRSESEQRFVNSNIKLDEKKQAVVSVGIDVPDFLTDAMKRLQAVEEFKSKYGIEGDYIIYSGRISNKLGCDKMFDIYRMYRGDRAFAPISLVAIGRADNDMVLPRNIGAYYPGFLSEKEKLTALAGAKFQWVPASVSINKDYCLMGMALGVPPIANRECENINEQIKRSEAGYTYSNDAECCKIIKDLEDIGDENYAKVRVRARFYIKNNYSWEASLKKMQAVIG